MTPQLLLISALTFIATLSGGLLAYKFKNHLNLIMGFTAGVILGVICLEIIPEIMHLFKEGETTEFAPMLAMIFGFLFFHILEKSILIHHSQDDQCLHADHTHPQVGVLSSMMLALHSFLDGLGIAISFLINPITGFIVSLAVIGHNFADGINSVALMLTHKNSKARIIVFLLITAISPTLGILSGIVFKIPQSFLAIYLGYFAGSLLYIGSSEILPEAHRKKNSMITVLFTVVGTIFILLLTSLFSHSH